MPVSIDAILPRVQRPARYAGGELNAIYKNPAEVALRFAFAFPDVYEIAMSHLGMKILTDTLNRRADTWCERVFAPWVDMEAEMRAAGIPLFALESRDPVAMFDIIGFTLQYELSYTNVLNMLDLAGLPLKTRDRLEGGYPLVIAGGPCAFNPMPLNDFIDLFAIGDGEESIHDIANLAIAHKKAGSGREDFLRAAAGIPGIYVPMFPKRTRKRVVADLNAADYPDAPVVPGAEAAHDRVMLEVARGCTRGCRFCAAGMLCRPARERSVERLVGIADRQIAATGYDEISMTALSAGDYSCLPELSAALGNRYAEQKVSVSLPSLRVDAALSDTLQTTAGVRKSSLTFAPEAGTQRLRDAINKGVTRENLLDAARSAFEAGYTSIKLYFMLGLPTETDEDVLGIAQLARDVVTVWHSVPREKRPGPLSLGVSASSFVPKPHTPFQWDAQDAAEELTRKQRMLREALRIKGVTFSWHDAGTSVLEAAFSRGGPELGAVLEEALRRGARFDGWSEQFNPKAWAEAFVACGTSPEAWARRAFDFDEPLPWDIIDSGLAKSFLKWERHNADEARTTPNCAGHDCQGCGLQEHCFAGGGV